MLGLIAVSLLAGIGIGIRIKKIRNNIKLTWRDHLTASFCLAWLYIVFSTVFGTVPQ